MSARSHLILAFVGERMNAEVNVEQKTQPRKRARQDRSRATVEALIEGTARVLIQDGFERASTNKIAKEAGVSIGSLYQYFPNKESLVAALIEEETQKDLKAILQRLEEVEGHDPADALREVVLVVTGCYGRNKPLRKVIVDQVPKIGKLKKIQELENEVGGIIYDRLVRPAGLSDDDAALDKFILIKSITGILRSATLERAELLDERGLVDRMVKFCLTAMVHSRPAISESYQ